MKRLFKGGVLIIVGVLLAVAPAVAGDESDLEGRLATWQTEYNAGNHEALVSMLYTDDACRMPPNQEAVNGSEAILAQMLNGIEMGIVTVELGLTSASTSGEMGWGSGTYVIMDGEGLEIDNGKWMNVSKKVDGTWMIYCDIWNSNVPLPIIE